MTWDPDLAIPKLSHSASQNSWCVVQGDRDPKDGTLDDGGPGKLQKEDDRVHEVLEISWKFYILPF